MVLLSNSSEIEPDSIFDEALQIYFDISQPAIKLLDMTAVDFQDLIGKYENIEIILTISLKKNELWLEIEHKGGFPTPDSPPMPMPPPMRIGFYDQDKVITLDGSLKDKRGELLRASNGTLTWFRYGYRIHTKIQ